MRMATWSHDEANKMRIQLQQTQAAQMMEEKYCILKWDHAVTEAAQKQTQRGFLPQQELILLEELANK